MPVLSANDCIAPAFRLTIQQFFRPFRFPFWLRMAVLGFFTGEMSGGGGAHFNGPSDFRKLRGAHGGHGVPPVFAGHMGWFTPMHILELAIGFAVVIFVISLIFLYIGSILRFVLFDTVLHGDPRLRSGWQKWRGAGRRYFEWQFLLLIIGWGIMLAFIVVPLLFLLNAHHLGFWFIDATGIASLAVAALWWFLLAMALFIVAVLAKDFVVPIMALEGVGWQEGWRRFRAIASGHFSEYFFYFVFKIVLRIGAAIAIGVLFFFIILIVAIPAAVLGFAGVMFASGAGLAAKAFLITLAIVAGILLVAFFIVLSAVIAAPIAFFFPAYSVYFFAGRYAPLGQIVFPEPQPLPPPPFTPPPAPAL